MALPIYATTGQRIWHYTYLTICGLVLFLLVAPLIIVIPLSFTSSPFLSFTPEMLALKAEGFSVRWYQNLFGMCEEIKTTVCSDKWMTGFKNSIIIGIFATILSTVLGTLAALGLSRSHMPGRKLFMALLISPMIVPLIITAAGFALFSITIFGARFDLVASHVGLVIAHAILGLPFVVITVTATLVGFDDNLRKAAANLGAGPTRTFFKIQMPLILPGVISGALFAFITSFDEVVVVIFLAGADQLTLPRQMWAGIRQEISPTILAAATILVIISIVLLTVVELLRRRSERLRGVSPG